MYIVSCEKHLFFSGQELLVQALHGRACSALGMTSLAKFVRFCAGSDMIMVMSQLPAALLRRR